MCALGLLVLQQQQVTHSSSLVTKQDMLTMVVVVPRETGIEELEEAT